MEVRYDLSCFPAVVLEELLLHVRKYFKDYRQL